MTDKRIRSIVSKGKRGFPTPATNSGKLQYPNGGVVAVHMSWADGSGWLCETKNKGSPWGVYTLPDGGDLDESLPLNCLFLISGGGQEGEEYIYLKNVVSSNYLSRHKDRDPLTKSKFLKEPQLIDVSEHPMWKMSKSRKSNSSILGVRDGSLHCGGAGACSWSVRELFADIVEERLRGHVEEEEDEEELEDNKSKEPRVVLEEFFKKGKGAKLRRTPTPPPSKEKGENKPPASPPFNSPSFASPTFTSPAYSSSSHSPALASSNFNSPSFQSPAFPSPSFSGVNPPPFSQSNRTATSPPTFMGSIDPSSIPKPLALPPKNLSFSMDSLALLEQNRPKDKNENDRDKLISVLRVTLSALGMNDREIQSQISQINSATDHGSGEFDWVKMEKFMTQTSENVIEPTLLRCKQNRNAVQVQALIRGYLIRSRREKLLRSISREPSLSMKLLHKQVDWVKSLNIAEGFVISSLNLFMKERVEPLREIANDSLSEEEVWIDPMTAEALFGAWSVFLKFQMKWHKKLLAAQEQDWPSISGVVEVLNAYTKEVEDALLGVSHQSQAIFETYENLRSFKPFFPFSRPLTLKPTLSQLSLLPDRQDIPQAVLKRMQNIQARKSPPPRISKPATLPKDEGGGLTTQRRSRHAALLQARKGGSLKQSKEEVSRMGREKEEREDQLEESLGLEEAEEAIPQENEADKPCSPPPPPPPPPPPMQRSPSKDSKPRKRDDKKRQSFFRSPAPAGPRLPPFLESKSISSGGLFSKKKSRSQTPPPGRSNGGLGDSGDSFSPLHRDRSSVSPSPTRGDMGQEEDLDNTSPLPSPSQIAFSPPLISPPALGDVESEPCQKEMTEESGEEVCRRCRSEGVKEGKEEEGQLSEGNIEEEEMEKEENEEEQPEEHEIAEDEEDKQESREGKEQEEHDDILDLDEDDSLGSQKDETKKKPKLKSSMSFDSLYAKKGESLVDLISKKKPTHGRGRGSSSGQLASLGKVSSIRLNLKECDPSMRSISRVQNPDTWTAREKGENIFEMLDMDHRIPKQFQWFITLPFEYLEFLKGHTKRLWEISEFSARSEWGKEHCTQIRYAYDGLQKLQKKVNQAINYARFSSSNARFAQVQDFTLPEYDNICGDGPLRMLLVENSVVLLEENGALIERHLVMFTDMIMLLRRNTTELTTGEGGMWQIHDEFGGMIYFGLVKKVEIKKTKEGACTALSFVDVNSKSETIKTIEIFGRHQEECRLWCERFTERMETNNAVFGKPISQVVTREGGTIPYILKATLKQLLARGTETEGIFRLAGNLKRARYLRVLFNKGMSRYVQSDILEKEDVHTLAALLKLYLRELPEPLFSFELYEKLMEEKGNIKRKTMLKQLSESHYAVLASVMGMVREVALNQEKTKMGSYNLAVVFCPNLFQPPKGHQETPESLIISTTYVQMLIEHFMRHPPTVNLE